MNLFEKYQERCSQPSDINQLLPYLKDYADRCDVVIELGVRQCVSIYAFLVSNAKTIYGYDIDRWPEVTECEQLAREAGKDFKFVNSNVLRINIPECDFLFIDTFHSKAHLKTELILHAYRAKKYIGFHDTYTYWEKGEDGREGLRYAIEPFLQQHPEWKTVKLTNINNGLMIIEKI